MSERELLVSALKGNMEAVRFCESWFSVTQVWDDLIDKDKPVTDEQINQTHFTMLIDINSNPFFLQNRTYLLPILNSAIIDYIDANKMEKMGESQQRVAYVIRDTASTIVTHCAFLVAGFDWMQKVSTDIRLWLHDEDFNDYQESI